MKRRRGCHILLRRTGVKLTDEAEKYLSANLVQVLSHNYESANRLARIILTTKAQLGKEAELALSVALIRVINDKDYDSASLLLFAGAQLTADARRAVNEHLIKAIQDKHLGRAEQLNRIIEYTQARLTEDAIKVLNEAFLEALSNGPFKDALRLASIIYDTKAGLTEQSRAILREQGGRIGFTSVLISSLLNDIG